MSRAQISCAWIGALFLVFVGQTCGQCLDGTVGCHVLAYCDDTSDQCACFPGAFGDGLDCSRDSWTVRFNIIMPNSTVYSPQGNLLAWDVSPGGNVETFANMMFAVGEAKPAGFLTSIHHSVHNVEGDLYLTINSLFVDETAARTAASALTTSLAVGPTLFGVDLTDASRIPVEPRVYAWSLETTDGPIQIAPTGMSVDSVSFQPTCGQNGCWVVGVTYTTGVDTFNTLFIPRAEIPFANLSYDFDYDSTRDTDDLNWLNWGKTAADTFLAVNFPCGSSDYDPGEVHRKTDFVINPRNPSPPDAVTSCCIPEFMDMYRPIQDFVDFFENHPRARVRKDRCDGGLVETWHRPSWPNPVLVPPIPPQWINDGNWMEIDCYQGGVVDLTPSKLNSDKADDYGFYWQESNTRLGMSKAGWEERKETARCPASCDGGFCVVGDDSDGGGTVCEDQIAKWMKEEKCYANKGENTVGKLDMGCYEDGEVKTWVIQAPTNWSFDIDIDGDNNFVSPRVQSMFGDEQPVVIIDVLSLSLEDESNNKNSDRWDHLSVGICKHGAYNPSFDRQLREASIKDFAAQITAGVPPLPPSGLPVPPATWLRSVYDTAVTSPPLPPWWIAAGFYTLTSSPIAHMAMWSYAQLLDWLENDSMYADYTVPDDLVGVVDDFQYKMTAFYLDYNAPTNFGGEPEELYCPEVLWETGRDFSAGVVMPIQSGVRAGFRVVACTGAAVVKFISDAHSAHSTGFTINWRIVPQSEVSTWTGEAYGFDQGGWSCPVEPFFSEDSGDTPAEAFGRGQVILNSMTSGGGPIGPYVDGWGGMAFPPAVQEVVGDWYDNAVAFCDREEIEAIFGNVSQVPAYHSIPPNYMTGSFADMEYAWAEFTSVMDPFIKQYKATIYLDDTELREKAGMLRGTVGAEYTIDTFIGLANFKPTNTKFLDPFGTQVALHLERNNFFSVSTHGVNEYTFLEYVNMRLVTILAEDADLLPETSDEFADRTGRVSAGDEAQYVQVTFTLGSQYRPIETGLIPMDSVVVSKGTFLEAATTTATRSPVCDQWSTAAFTRQSDFQTRLQRDCAPQATMCDSPTDIPDGFVSFNVPLGFDWLPGASDTLDSSVFVEMVVSAIDNTVSGGPRDPLSGDPGQMKTTLTGSIPVVTGGLNVFCDGIFAKTDLKDVVDVDIVVGSAASEGELSRLRILTDIASTDLQSVASQRIDSDSIEAGLMTLVVKGDPSYFGLGGSQYFGLQLEDVITIHIMESGTALFDSVTSMVGTAGADNRDSNGVIDTDGYDLNQAFRFTIDRAQNRAYLEPTDMLLGVCPFSPARPTEADPFPTTCVTRRDVRGRLPVVPTGGMASAIELDQQSVDAASRTGSGLFMQTVLGASTYAENLGKDFSKLIADEYQLNGQFRRAWWINPGYEWTPSQTGGQPIFTVSQKIILFALINLDEGFTPGRRHGARRALLQSTTEDTGAGLGSAAFEFNTSPEQLMAETFGTALSRVATYKVTLRLTPSEACQAASELRTSLLGTFEDYLSQTASSLETVQIVGMTVNPNGVQCSRRSRVGSRSLLAVYSDATADVVMLVVFTEGTKAVFNQERFGSLAGVESIEALSVSSDVEESSTYVRYFPDEEPEDSSAGSNTALIAGCAAGGVVLVALLGLAAYKLLGRRDDGIEDVPSSFAVQDLKAQLTLQDGESQGLTLASPRGADRHSLFPPMGGGATGHTSGLFADMGSQSGSQRSLNLNRQISEQSLMDSPSSRSRTHFVQQPGPDGGVIAMTQLGQPGNVSTTPRGPIYASGGHPVF